METSKRFTVGQVGPENPYLTAQQKATKNMLTGYVEQSNVSNFQFETQRRTFHSYGKILLDIRFVITSFAMCVKTC